MRKIRFFIYIFLFILFSVPFLGAQFTGKGYYTILSLQDTLPPTVVDSSRFLPDSLSVDSVPKKKSALEAIVDYTSKDSIVMTADNWGYLYGEAEVKYADITLKGEKVFMNMDSSLVYATFGLDSVGKEFGFPVFADKNSELESKTMKYNFKTKKGYSTHLVTAQGEGYIIADMAKKNEDDSYFTEDAKYTTCDDHEHPHFYLALTRGKVRHGKNVVAGPAYLVIEDLPLFPIGLPFGFFPFSSKYSSGIIMPSYGDELERGFNLRDGGYYFAISDHIDLALTGEIYTKGSWGLNARSTYRKRYKYSGSFDAGYIVTKTGEKDINYSVAKDMRLNWTHSQDPKFDQFRTVSASVNFSTSSYDRNNLNSIFTPAATQNTKSSTVNITQRIPNSPWSFSASINAAQRTSDSTISLTLPNMTMTMSRVAPFKRKEAVGAERWYEKIQLSYSGDLRNSIQTKEDRLFKSNLMTEWEHAMKHSIPVSATFNVLNYLNITPSFNYTERWYTRKVGITEDPNTRTLVPKDTTNGFNRVYDFNAALSFQTKLYGMFTPVFYDKAQIRHVFSPSISLSYAPDFGGSRFGYYETYYHYDYQGNYVPYTYSPYRYEMFGVPGQGSQGAINFQFENNVEMKVKKIENDSVKDKKYSLIDNLGIGFSYNMQAKEFKWSDINTSLRLKLSKSFPFNVNAIWDPYLYKVTQRDNEGKATRVERVNELRIANGKGFGRLRSIGYSISPSINQDTFKKWFGKDKDKESGKDRPDEGQRTGTVEGEGQSQERKSLLSEKKDDNEYDEDGYVKNEIKWSLNFNLSMNYNLNPSRWSEPDSNGYAELKGQLTKNFGFSGNIQPTKNWSFNFNASYDFNNKKLADLTCNITRNLHCWSLSASFIPVGPYKTYYVSLRASSSMLQDLKYENRGRPSGYDPDWN
ncbi:MAG: LPS-assembly protein LptD [Prevotella sp.]|jgi:lipopolysaccharide assembly outer membrane protein LptD (OstA)|nr:LPS-assembly protein LptD [Prevotella sp.]